MTDTTLTAGIRTLADALEQRVADLAAREQQIAAAAETLSQSAAVQAAWATGQQHERGRIVALIDLQLEQLHRAGLNAITLNTLRQSILSGS